MYTCVLRERERGLLFWCVYPLWLKEMSGFTPTLPHTNTYLIEPLTIKLIRSQSFMSFPPYPQPLYPSHPLHRYLPTSLPSLSPTCCNRSCCFISSQTPWTFPLPPPLPTSLHPPCVVLLHHSVPVHLSSSCIISHNSSHYGIKPQWRRVQGRVTLTRACVRWRRKSDEQCIFVTKLKYGQGKEKEVCTVSGQYVSNKNPARKQAKLMWFTIMLYTAKFLADIRLMRQGSEEDEHHGAALISWQSSSKDYCEV